MSEPILVFPLIKVFSSLNTTGRELAADSASDWKFKPPTPVSFMAGQQRVAVPMTSEPPLLQATDAQLSEAVNANLPLLGLRDTGWRLCRYSWRRC